MVRICDLIEKMVDYDAGDMRRIPHFLKVYAYAKTIAELERLDEKTRYILELAAIVHDIGIKVSEQKYGNCLGKNQEKEGPMVAEQMLEKLGADEKTIERVCFLVSKHHTYGTDYGIDHQILIEADFLVNAEEEHMKQETVVSVRERVFKTASGTRFLNRLFGLDSRK